MNRKSNAANLRQSMKPRESHVPGSAGVTSSSRRGCGNRTILETTQDSHRSSRMTQYGQPVKKDPRTFNEEFIQTTFEKLRDFLTQRNLLSEMPPSPELTSRPFESLFLTLMRCCFPYDPPSHKNWIETEVPIIMESLGYPTKVPKSTLQTVSFNVGPIMGIIDFLIDLAVGMDVDPEQAIRSMTKHDQFGLETELLAQSTFAKGVTADAPHIQQMVKELCAKRKGVDDEDAIREEHERVLAEKAEAEATLQALEQQQAKLEAVQEECESHRQYIVEMEQWKQRKGQDLQNVRDQRKAAREKIAEVRQIIAESRKIVDAQPISQEDIRSIRAESKDLEQRNNLLQKQIEEASKKIDRQQADNRVRQSEITRLTNDLASILAAANMPESVETLTRIVGSAEETEAFLSKLKSVQDGLLKTIADFETEADQQLFELDLTKRELRTEVECATQDKEGADKMLRYYGERLAKRDAELLSKRQGLKNTDTLIAIAEKEVEDLKVQLEDVREQLAAAKKRREHQKFLAKKGEAFVKFYREKMEEAIRTDRARMEELVKFYQEQEKKIPLEETATEINKAIQRIKEASEED